MLSAIELYGFKSFADRTRLEFGEGISAVVGPNGSGKSNVVDAIKWVLGEQSVKKLRGSEMTDVIFSGSSSRAAVGAAEVTLSFDNSKRTFNVETSEVHITRRIYRSGEGEYLINRQAARLKDIRDLLSGVGLGAQAYSIIEQGRVETLLQSSGVQRRAIFEDAAGISRFNAKKQEVQRRLERVDQNLIRLSDIVNEVENQLKTVKSQAGKAQLYRQYTTRLQELRIQASLVDWRKNVAQIKILTDEIGSFTASEKEIAELVERFEKTVLEQNTHVEEANRRVGQIEGDITAVKERIFSEESTIELQNGQLEEIESEIVQHSRQLVDLNVRSGDTEEMLRKTEIDIKRAKDFNAEIANSYKQFQETAETLNKEFDTKQELCNKKRKELEDANRKISRTSGEIDGLESRCHTFLHSKQQSATRVENQQKQIADLAEKAERLEKEYAVLEDSTASRAEQLEQAKRQKSQVLDAINRLSQELLEGKQRLSGVTERISVLEELLNKHEGLSPGVKEVMRQSRIAESPFRHVHGLVADLFRVEVEAAPLIELALGSSAQHIVVAPEPELFRYIEQTANQFAGRVGFIWLDPNASEIPWIKKGGFTGRNGVIGRADQFVQTDTTYTLLSQRLLGRTWIVQNIAVAKQLYRESDDRTNFLTIHGEYLAADGTIIVGPPTGISGVITRRSELRTLNEQIQIIENYVRDKEIAITVQKNMLVDAELEVEKATQTAERALSELESKRNSVTSLQERMTQQETELSRLQSEFDQLSSQLEKANQDCEEARNRQTELENSIKRIEAELTQADAALEEIASTRREHTKKLTNTKIELAKSDERLDFLKDRIKQYEDHQVERQNLLDEHQKRLCTLTERRDQILLSILRTEANIALLYVRKEALVNSVSDLFAERNELLEKRNSVQHELKKNQHELNRIKGKFHAKQLELERINQEQKVLSDRMREDYNIDIEEYDSNHSVSSRLDVQDSENQGSEKQSSEKQSSEEGSEEQTVSGTNENVSQSEPQNVVAESVKTKDKPTNVDAAAEIEELR
ncbi:MAG: chromosome segregation protein SMC, partial [Thermoguttaceae bacterium]